MNNKTKILVVEDEPQMQRFLEVLLNGHHYQTVIVGNAKDGLFEISNWQPNIVLLDLGLPDQDGLTLISRIREFTKVPIIVISARELENDKVKALDNGADDYLTKPFGSSELLARVRVALRHIEKQDESMQLMFESDDLTIDFSQRLVWKHNELVHLTPIEFRILYLMASNNGKVLTYSYILKAIWGANLVEQNHYVRVHVAQMRRKIEVKPAQPKYLLTENGIGYRFQFDSIRKNNND